MEIKTKGRSTRQGEGKGKSQSKNSLLSIEAENQPRTYYHTTNIVMGFGLMKLAKKQQEFVLSIQENDLVIGSYEGMMLSHGQLICLVIFIFFHGFSFNLSVVRFLSNLKKSIFLIVLLLLKSGDSWTGPDWTCNMY